MAVIDLSPLAQPIKPSTEVPQLTFETLDKPATTCPYTHHQTVPVSACQSDIIQEDIPQWVQAVIFTLAKDKGNADRVQNIWNQLCSHYEILNATIQYDTITQKHVNFATATPSTVQVIDITKNAAKSTNTVGSATQAHLTIQFSDIDNLGYVVLNAPRALLDTTSLSLVARGFAALYNGAKLPGHVPFGIYLASVAHKDTHTSLEFWANAFDGVSSKSLVPADRYAAAERSSVYIDLDHNTCDLLRQLDQTGVINRKSLFETLWALTLQRHADTQDVAFAVMGRDATFTGADTCVGLVDHVYPVRETFTTETTFMEAAQDLQSFHRKASQHAHLGYRAIEDVLASGHIESIVACSPDIKHLPPGGIENTFPISIFIAGTSSTRVTASFYRDHSVGRAEMLLRHFIQAISDVARQPSLSKLYCKDVDLGSPEERQVILAYAQEKVNTVAPSTIVKLFEQSVINQPNKCAIQFGSETIVSYQELNAMANKLARGLRLHIGEIVPICISRSVELIASILAVLKAGAAYTVLDPEAPLVRNESIIEACGARGVLVQTQLAGRFENAWNVDDVLEDYAGVPDENLDIGISTKDTAYIVFTSGSTGKPKGVVISHGAATSGMQCHSVSGLDRWLLFYNPIFSAAQRTMLSTLVHGATLLIARKDKLVQDLPTILKTMRVDALGITPSALAALPDGGLANVQRVVMVGEAVSNQVIDRWADKVDLFNTYGLSECAQLNFSHRLLPGSNSRIVGSPVDTTAAYILKPGTNELVPIGIPGELCLASRQLADGYLNLPDVTARVFQANPFGSGMLFRTGDAARLLPTGEIQVTGRLDLQTKIAGQKVDPAEIDQVLRQHPAILRSATAAVELHKGSDDVSLVAAIVLHSEYASNLKESIASLREHVASRLPSYMVPAFWAPVDSIPSNANGKVDIRAVQKLAKDIGAEGLLRKALGVSDDDSDVSDPIELIVAECWADFLDIPTSIIKRQHDFVSLGGSSIQAIRSISMLQDKGYVATMADILAPGTSLTDLAALLMPLDAAATTDIEPFSLVPSATALKTVQGGQASDAYPATPLQESLLASLTTGDDADMYIYHRVWKVGHLNLARLRKAMEAAYNKSDILRTSFAATSTGYLQVVNSSWQLPWAETDEDLASAIATAKRFLNDASKSLMQVVVVRQQYLVIVTHHALFDFWSHRFFYHDAAAAYEGDEIPNRPKFSRFVKHLNQFNEEKSHGAFWSKYLQQTEYATMSSSIIPTDDMSTTITTTKVPALGRRIAQAGFTAGSVLYSAWALLLWRRTRSVDTVFATTFSGRDAPVPGIDRMDGPTLTTVPQRIMINPDEPVQTLVWRVAEELYQVMSHSQTGMRDALAAGGLGATVVDTLINVLVRNEEPEQVWSVFRPSGARSIWESDRTTMEIDLDGTDNGDAELRLIGKIDKKQAGFLLTAYAELIESVVSNPQDTVSSISRMTAEERRVVAADLTNAETCVYPTPGLLHAPFVEIAHTNGDLVAVDWRGDSQQTYRELNARANRVAHHLLTLGAKIGDKVPLIMDKSEETMSIILGVMKAGAAYIPLSPENNAARNDFIVNDVKAKLVILHREYLDRLTIDGITPIIVEDLISQDPIAEDPVVNITPDDHAYVIYTSGSTGVPKGVQVPHRSSAAAVTSMVVAERRHVGEWRTLQFANYVFDASVQDFFNTLSTGGTLCMAPTDEMQSNLPGLINKMRVKQAILTPTVGKILHPEDVPTMETLILGGEPMTKDVVDKWLPHCTILNVYGPTETSMVVTTKDVQANGKTAAIGAPFPTVMAYLVDPDGEDLVPYGSVGELCIAGPQVTDGYVGRKDLTDAAYTSNKTLGIDNLYRTGDLARWLPNGDIECLGRKDNQVKIHGLRIELAEIEQAIIKTGFVHDGNVVVMPFGSGINLSLVAFCVFESKPEEPVHIQEAAPFADTIRNLVDQLDTLSHYMIPKYILPATGFPKLPSLKTDRKTLKRWLEDFDKTLLPGYSVAGANSGPAAEYVPVATPAEAALEQMWVSILQLPEGTQIGQAASFVALGGDSIAAIRLVGLARTENYVLSVAKVLKVADLKEMALTMKIIETTESSQAAVEYKASTAVEKKIQEAGLDLANDVEYVYPVPSGQAEFLEHGSRQEQVWQLMAVRPMAHTTPEDWLASTVQLTAENDILRTCWTRDEESWAGVVLKSTALDVVYATVANDDEKKAFVSKFWDTRFAFGSPFIKYAVLQTPESAATSWDLVIKMDHGVYDGTLFRILDDQWTELRQGMPISEHGEFRDFALATWAEDKQDVLDYWKDTMQGKPSTFNATNNQPITDGVVRRKLEVDVDDVARACSVTPAIIFQAAYQIYMARRSASGRIGFDYLLSGRNVQTSVDPQTINGTLANFLPMECSVAPETPVKMFIEDSQDLFWAATENGNVGLDEIYRAAGLDRAQYGNKSMFLYQPFEPIPVDTTAEEIENTRWLPLSKASQVKLLQPYELVVEVGKSVDDYRLAVYHSSAFYTKEDVNGLVEELIDIINTISAGVEGLEMRDLLN